MFGFSFSVNSHTYTYVQKHNLQEAKTCGSDEIENKVNLFWTLMYQYKHLSITFAFLTEHEWLCAGQVFVEPIWRP